MAPWAEALRNNINLAKYGQADHRNSKTKTIKDYFDRRTQNSEFAGGSFRRQMVSFLRLIIVTDDFAKLQWSIEDCKGVSICDDNRSFFWHLLLANNFLEKINSTEITWRKKWLGNSINIIILLEVAW